MAGGLIDLARGPHGVFLPGLYEDAVVIAA